MKKIGFVIPCYRSEKTINGVVQEIEDAVSKMHLEYEILLVNDYSPDNTFQVIKSIAETHHGVTAVNMAKNFGQHAAIMAGFSYLSDDTDVVCCLDDDGQTPADEVEKMLSKLEEGYDLVYAEYETKEHSSFRNFGSKINSMMAEHLLGKPKDLYLSSYFVARRFVIEKILEYENPYPYLPGLVLRTTGNIGNVSVQHRSREIGTSGYTMKKLLGLWLNGFTAFSIKPLRIATLLGFVSAIGGFLFVIYTIINKIININVPVGWSSTIAAIFLMGGLILMVLGMIGEYIGRIYISMNKAPQYVIRECINPLNEEEREG